MSRASARRRRPERRVTPATAARPEPPPWVRSAVRQVLEQSPGYHALPVEHQQNLAHAMVKVSALASDLIGEELGAQAELTRPSRPPPLARAQDAQPFGEAANRVASTTRNVLNAVSFPRFVTELINGVFKAMLDSNAIQMKQFVDLLNNVSASAEGFAGSQFSLDYVRGWLADKFPESLEIEQPDAPDPGDAPVAPEDRAPVRLRLIPGKQMPEGETLRTALGMQPDESIDASSPEQLVPLARRQIARQRQQMLATMVMLGMQRIVVDSGKINAAMRFHIDTRSIASQEQGSSFSMQNRIKASGSFGAGPWGVSAEAENTIGYVTTQRSQSSEELNTDLDLSSSVEINFRSDYLPLNRMAAQGSADRIRANSLNPQAEAAAASAERTARQAGQRASETARSNQVNAALAPAAPVPPPQPARTPATPAPAAGQPVAAPSPGGAPPPPAGGTPRPAVGAGNPAPAPAPAGGAAATNPAGNAPAPVNPPAGGQPANGNAFRSQSAANRPANSGGTQPDAFRA